MVVGDRTSKLKYTGIHKLDIRNYPILGWLECKTPWHSLIEHQPIGSIDQLSWDVYAASTKHHKICMPEFDLSQKERKYENN